MVMVFRGVPPNPHNTTGYHHVRAPLIQAPSFYPQRSETGILLQE